MRKRMTGVLQENVLALLLYDTDYNDLLRNALSYELFETDAYRDIAQAALDFSNQFKEPIKDHIADVKEPVLEAGDSKARWYSKQLRMLRELYPELNKEYVIGELRKFIELQNTKIAVVDASQALERDDADEARSILSRVTTDNAMTLFDPGTRLSDRSKALSFLRAGPAALYKLGIDIFDHYDVVPARQEMGVLIAPPKRGKTMWLIYNGKKALQQRLKVLHISLEMSEERIMQRYVQALFSITKRQATLQYPEFRRTRDGEIEIEMSEALERPALTDPEIAKILNKRLDRTRISENLIVKAFPSGTLTIKSLNAYLDMLASTERFHPDLLIIDYPDLFKISAHNRREELGRIFVECRGIAAERKCALQTVTQGNRESASAKLVTTEHVAEDWSKIATADYVYTYNQTEQEKAVNLARLFVAAARNDTDNCIVAISQAYEMGQFVMSATTMVGEEYWHEVESMDVAQTADQ